MNAKTYLETVPRDVLEGLYRILADGRYTGEADERVAAHLTTQARVSGHLQLTISGPTLGKRRSSIGLVSHRSPRLGPTSIDPDGAPAPTPAAVELQPELAGFTDAEWRGLVAGFLDEMKNLSSEFRQLRAVIAKRFPEIDPKAKEERPELRVVGGAER